MSTAKFQATHGIVGNAPQIIMVLADDPLLAQRLFTGVGAPAVATLLAGNGKYCGATSGFIVAATLFAAGSGYQAGDVLTLSTGTATTALQITVDAVSAAGAITDYHVSRTGVYTAFPNTTSGVTGGHGSSAVFLPAIQPADTYLDSGSKQLYLCSTGGTSTTAVWVPISIGIQQFKIQSDGGDYWVCKTWDGYTLGSTAVNVAKPFKLRCGSAAIGTETIRGKVQNYTYTPVTVLGVTGYYIRTVKDGSGVVIEQDVMIPDPLAGDIIYAVAFATIAPDPLASVTLIDLNLDERGWSEI